MKLLLAPATILLVASWHDPAVFLYALAIAAVVLIGALWVVAHDARRDVADLRAEQERTDAEHEAECQRLQNALTEAQLAAGKTPRALRVVPSVPAQRSDSWLEQIMDEQEKTWLEGHGDGGAS